LEMARRVGATHVVNSSKDDPVKAVRALTRGAGVDHAFEAVGNTTLVRQAIESLAIRGTATIVGVMPPDAKIEFPWMAIRPECKVQTSRMGGNRFRTDIPRYLEFYRQGRLLLDEMVTRRVRLDDINEAFRAMKAHGADVEVISPMPELCAYWFTPGDALDFCRYTNEAVARMCAAVPGRFIGLGIVPLQDPELAAKELAHIKSLGFPGIELGSNVNGKSLGMPEFQTFFQEAQRLGVSIFVHA